MTKLGKTGIVGVGIGLVLGLSLATVPGDAGAWEPKKPVEFVIMAGKGGGADKVVRFMQNIIAKNKLSSKPFTPVNKPGGRGGAEALVHVKSASDPNHTIMFTLNSFYISKFTPIGRMAEDTFLLWVNEDSGITNVKQFVRAAKAKGANWVMASTSARYQYGLLMTSSLNSAYGLKMKYVPYRGGRRVAEELVGKNTNSTMNTLYEQLGFWQAGKTRPLAAFAPDRMPVLKDVPTLRELGQDLVFRMGRHVVGAPGMSGDARDYYQRVFKKVYDSDEWQGYMSKRGLRGAFLTGALLKNYWKWENKGLTGSRQAGSTEMCGTSCPKECENGSSECERSCRTSGKYQCCTVSSMPRFPTGF